MLVRGLWVAWLLLLLTGGAVADGIQPPAMPNANVKLRILLNEDTKPLALAALGGDESGEQIAQVVDVLLEQTQEVTFWRYGLLDPNLCDFESTLAFYGEWAAIEGLRSAARYVDRDVDVLGQKVVEGLGELHLGTGPEGGVLGVYAQEDTVNVLWATGSISLGPLIAPLLGLPPLAGAIPDALASAEPALPELPSELPMELLMGSLDLTSAELMPLAAEIAARAGAAGEDSELSADALMLMGQGPSILENVEGLSVLAFDTPSAEDVERVVSAATAYATERGWTPLMELNSGGVEGQLFAKLGDDGGVLVVGEREDMTALLITQGAPNLMALLGAFSS